jgi:2-polyprenyl-3-methyl-5-hydroxy-6-metoxy-1,4-benzoquinol methylase
VGFYDSDYYHQIQDGSWRSAKVVIPILLARFSIKSVVDVGCGTGGWLSEFARAGISDYLGIDGDYVPRKLLKIPESCFRAVDLATMTDVGRRFDMALSLEVAEYLPGKGREGADLLETNQ